MSLAKERLSTFQEISRSILDALFPILCLGCEKRGEWICKKCQEKIPLRIDQACPFCKRERGMSGKTCPECQNKTSLSGLFAVTYLETPIMKKVLHIFKERFVSELAEPLSEITVRALSREHFSLPDLIVPVPLERSKLRLRGFNQASLLAKSISEKISFEKPVPYSVKLLCRIHSKKLETKNPEKRKANLSGTFFVDPELSQEIKDKNIWLIDDVTNTGVTIEECAKTLKESGARNVFGIVLAR